MLNERWVVGSYDTNKPVWLLVVRAWWLIEFHGMKRVRARTRCLVYACKAWFVGEILREGETLAEAHNDLVRLLDACVADGLKERFKEDPRGVMAERGIGCRRHHVQGGRGHRCVRTSRCRRRSWSHVRIVIGQEMGSITT